VGTRLRVYAGSDNLLHGVDLGVFSGSSAPMSGQLTTLSTSSLCSTVPTVLNDYANPSNSLLVLGATGCDTQNSRVDVIPISSSSTFVPSPSPNEPVDVARDASGAIAAVFVVIHSSPPQIGFMMGTAGSLHVIGNVSGKGILGALGDFASLGVFIQSDGSYVWLWHDNLSVNGCKLAAGVCTPIVLYPVEDTDSIQGPAIPDPAVPTTVYLASSDSSHNTQRLVQIDTANGLVTNGGQDVLSEQTGGSSSPYPGIRLLGVAGSYLVYSYSDSSELRFVTKSPGSGNTGVTIWGPSGTGAILDQQNVPVIVGNAVYFTVTTGGGITAAGGTSQAYYFLDYSGSGVPVSIGGSSSLVIGAGGAFSGLGSGGVVATPMSTSNPASPSYVGALVFEFSSTPNDPIGGGTFAQYDAIGTRLALGTITPAQHPLISSYDSALLIEGPLQIGQPALLELTGQAASGNAAADLYQFTPGTQGLTQLTFNVH
jgi:hypothetical protein